MDIQLVADDWLSILEWGLHQMTFPTFHNLTRGYEAWAYEQQRFKQQFIRLERRRLIQRKEESGRVFYRLTALGRLTVLGRRNPEERWNRPWDGRWRMVVFDLPVGHQNVRQRFLRWLRQNGFGYLQDSVWIHPDPVTELTDALKQFRNNVESLTILEARCCAGYSNGALVRGAWPFREINQRYRAYLHLTQTDWRDVLRSPTPSTVLNWVHRERAAWKNALAVDPLLPSQLCPKDYLGEKAWAAKRATLVDLAPLLGSE